MRPAWVWVALAVGLALVWPALQVAASGSIDGLLRAGDQGPARDQILEDIPDLHTVEGVGHDGQIYYLIARHPLDPDATTDEVTDKGYRYRRITYPLVAAVLAPGGGRAVIVVFLLESLVGVALGAWALTRLPGAPPWLPVSLAASPGTIAALGLSLSDALAAGLGLAAVALSLDRRWRPMLACLVLAALTRETMLIFAVGLAFAPGASRAWRVATVAVPSLALGSWSLWVAGRAGQSAAEDGAAGIALPLVEWFDAQVEPSALALGVAAFGLLLVGAWRARDVRPVAVILALSAALVACYSREVAFDWVNSMRPIAGVLPLALWALVRPAAGADQPDGPPAPADEMATTASTAATGMAP